MWLYVRIPLLWGDLVSGRPVSIFVSVIWVRRSTLVLVRLRPNSLKFFVIKKLITFYLSFLFFVRAFFLKERPYIIPFIILVFSVNLYYPFLPFTTTIYSQMFSLIYSGLYLISIDSICSYVSKKIVGWIVFFIVSINMVSLWEKALHIQIVFWLRVHQNGAHKGW